MVDQGVDGGGGGDAEGEREQRRGGEPWATEERSGGETEIAEAYLILEPSWCLGGAPPPWAFWEWAGEKEVLTLDEKILVYENWNEAAPDFTPKHSHREVFLDTGC